jgi:hypothetical protein
MMADVFAKEEDPLAAAAVQAAGLSAPVPPSPAAVQGPPGQRW